MNGLYAVSWWLIGTLYILFPDLPPEAHRGAVLVLRCFRWLFILLTISWYAEVSNRALFFDIALHLKLPELG